jgi:hypothetical protein
MGETIYDAIVEREKVTTSENIRSKIMEYFTADELMKLYHLCLYVQEPDLNIKAKYIIEEIRRLYNNSFISLGTGTNRTAFKNEDGYVFKIALDKRGLNDNLEEFFYSGDEQDVFTKCYETNILVTISEYIEPLDITEFNSRKGEIYTILKKLSEKYIFGDLGIGSNKNITNFGIDRTGRVKILDYGYLERRDGNEEALICPCCGDMLVYTENFDGFICPNCQHMESATTILETRINKDKTFEFKSKIWENLTGTKLHSFYDLEKMHIGSRKNRNNTYIPKRRIFDLS